MAIQPDYLDNDAYPDIDIKDFTIEQDPQDPEVLSFPSLSFTADIKSYKILVIANDDYYQFMPFEQRPDFTAPLENYIFDSDPANGYEVGDIASVGPFTPGNKYKFRVTAYSGFALSGAHGNSVTKSYLVPKPISNATTNNTTPDPFVNPKSDTASSSGPPTWIPGTAYYIPPGSGGSENTGNNSSVNNNTIDESDPNIRSNSVDQAKINGLGDVIPRGVLALHGPGTQEQYNTAIAYNTFNAITVPANLNSYEQYYSFGSTLFLSDDISNPNQSAGFGFFLSDKGTSGYYVRIQTSAAVATYNTPKSIQVMKIQNNEKKRLADSQTTDISKLVGVYGGKIYKVDVKVKATETRTEITVYVNGFKITATDIQDISDPKLPKNVLPPTQKMGLFAYAGSSAYFDYVYGSSIDKAKFFDEDYLYNVFSGQYSKNILSAQYGDKVFNTASVEASKKSIEEFGTTARELRMIKTRFNARPAKPVYISTGINKLVEVVGSKITNFGVEMYVVNNSGVFVPLDDGADNNFFVIGTTVAKTGEYVQSSTTLNDFTVEEPIIFQSNWIQKLPEAVALESWIKNKWSSKQMTVTMNIFGNPLLSVGDIIKIKHSYQKLDETRTFIILNVNHTYNQGLETEIVCRTL